MTILAGIVARASGVMLPEAARAALRRLVSRDARDAVDERGGAGWLMLKVDIGAFDSPAVCETDNHETSMLAGDPLLVTGSERSGRDRTADLQILHTAAGSAEWSVFATSTGTYCGAHFEPNGRTLTLFTDKVGLRPIYFWSNDQFVVYASAMRILEALPDVPKRMDLRGVSEIACFGFPLADRTAYEGIKTIQAGEIVRFSPQGIESVAYWRWDRLERLPLSEPDLVGEAHRRFVSGVQRRVGESRSEVAFLSGGLDSRAIVAALRSLDVDVDSINFAPRQTQDEVFAEQAARVFGTKHHYLGKDASSHLDRSEVYNQSVVSAWFDAQGLPGNAPPRQRRVWSGDGGSVALGHVYLHREAVELARRGDNEAAIDEFCRYNSLRLSPKLFHPSIAESVASFPQRGIRDELARLECPDRGRAFHLFLMLNDQRRHLFDFYENIDLGRIEFQLPFFDGNFLELILASPVDDFLGHRFYMRWMKNFPANVTSVPWQAYRGHEPCPLPIPPELGYQWSEYHDRSTLIRMKEATLDQARRLLSMRRFPDRIVDKMRLRLATWLTRLGLRDYSYVIHTAAVYGHYWRRCEADPQDQRTAD